MQPQTSGRLRHFLFLQVVGNGEPAVPGNGNIHCQRPLFCRNVMFYGIFYKYLQGHGRYHFLHQRRRNVYPETDLAAVTAPEHGGISFNESDLFFQPHLFQVAAFEHIPENIRHIVHKRHCGSLVALDQGIDGAEGIEQEMRVHLVLQYFIPRFRVGFQQGRIGQVHPVVIEYHPVDLRNEKREDDLHQHIKRKHKTEDLFRREGVRNGQMEPDQQPPEQDVQQYAQHDALPECRQVDSDPSQPYLPVRRIQRKKSDGDQQ